MVRRKTKSARANKAELPIVDHIHEILKYNNIPPSRVQKILGITSSGYSYLMANHSWTFKKLILLSKGLNYNFYQVLASRLEIDNPVVPSSKEKEISQELADYKAELSNKNTEIERLRGIIKQRDNQIAELIKQEKFLQNTLSHITTSTKTGG